MTLRQIALAVTMGLFLAGCGADGEPIPPEPRPEPGISVSGRISAGIAGRL